MLSRVYRLNRLCGAMVGLSMVSMAGAQSLQQAIQARIGDFQGTVSLYAKNLDTGATTPAKAIDSGFQDLDCAKSVSIED